MGANCWLPLTPTAIVSLKPSPPMPPPPRPPTNCTGWPIEKPDWPTLLRFAITESCVDGENRFRLSEPVYRGSSALVPANAASASGAGPPPPTARPK